MELLESLEAYFSETGYISALARRQARLLSRSAADKSLQAEARILLLLNLAALGRGAPRCQAQFLLEPLAGGTIGQHAEAYRRENENREPSWSVDLASGKTADVVTAMVNAAMKDPQLLAPLTGELPPVPGGGDEGAAHPLLVIDRGLMGFSRYFCAAAALEKNLRQRLRQPLRDLPAGQAAAILQKVFGTESILDNGKKFHVRQAMAAALALRAPVIVLSGGPGTGKTSVVVQILRALLAAYGDLSPDRIVLCAPTGRAKARLGECVDRDIAALETKFPSEAAGRISRDLGLKNVARKTLHSLLGIRPDGSMKYNARNPLPHQVIVVDEASMVDLYHFNALMEAASPDCRLLLVGDMHQLSPVEAGAVLGDLTRRFDSMAGHPALLPGMAQWVEQALKNIPLENDGGGGTLPAVLSVPDQAAKAGILANHAVILTKSHRSVRSILDLSDCVNRNDSDAAIKIIAGQDTAAAIELITGQGIGPVEAWLRERFSREKLAAIAGLRDMKPGDLENGLPAEALGGAFAVMHESRILTLAHEGPRGRKALNALADRLLRPLLDKGSRGPFFHGQQVILGSNHHDLDLYNGDTGIVVRTACGGLWAMFKRGSGFSIHAVERLSDLESAFAITVHKAQGSEFNWVMLVLPEHSSPLLTRQIVYTGITRAREQVKILGTNDMLRHAIETCDERPGGVELEGE